MHGFFPRKLFRYRPRWLRARKGSFNPSEIGRAPARALVGRAADDLGLADQPQMFGRDWELAELVGNRTAVTLVVGDSGIGKSRLLSAAVYQLSKSQGDAKPVCSSPVRLTHRPGALQSALLEALALAVAEYASSESAARRWQRIFNDALANVAENRVRDLIAGAHEFMLGVVRARLGDHAANLIADASKQLTLSSQEQLSHRIAAASDPDVLDTFRALATETARLSHSPVILVVDGVERLSDDDFRMLLDLVDEMPGDLRMLLGHSTRSSADLQRIRQLDELGAKPDTDQAGGESPSGRTLSVLPLSPLSEADIDEWMLALGLNPMSSTSPLDAVLLTTGGFPLYVDQALKALADGRGLGSVVGEEAFVSRNQQNYTSLDLEEQRIVMLLSAFVEPPDGETILALTGLDDQRWAVVQRRLIEARILVTSVGGQPWFHELGRRAIWSSTLTSAQRSSSAAIASRAILDAAQTAGGSSIQACMDLARLCIEAPGLSEDHELLASALDVGPAELSVLGALLELGEEGNQGVVSLEHLLIHARHRFGLGIAVGEVVDDLEGKGLVVTAENDHAVVVVPVWGSQATRMTVIGRIAEELARVPVPSLASELVGGYILPMVGEFAAATFGLGNPSVTELARQLKQLELDRSFDGEHEYVVHHDRPGLVTRPRFGGLGLYAAVNFESADRRDEAVRALQGVGDQQHFVMGERLQIDALLPWPFEGAPVSPLRFTRAAELATGEDFKSASRFTDSKTLPPVASLADELRLEMRGWRTIREMASPIERLAMDIEEARGLVLVEQESYAWVGEIRGRDEFVELAREAESLTSKKMFIELDSLAQLTGGQRIGTVRHRGVESRNPMPDVLATTRKRMRAFNQAQGSSFRLAVPDDEQELCAMLNVAHQQRYRDALKMLEDEVLPRIPDRLLGRDIFAVIRRHTAGERLYGHQHSLEMLSLRVTDGPGTVQLKITDDPGASSGIPRAEEFRALFEIYEFDPMFAGLSTSWLGFGLAAALGHEEVRLPERYWN